jgi:hypothetical protein
MTIVIKTIFDLRNTSIFYSFISWPNYKDGLTSLSAPYTHPSPMLYLSEDQVIRVLSEPREVDSRIFQ